MNIETYKLRRLELEKAKPKIRELCNTCLQPGFSCYCEHIQKFDPKVKFLILIHPIEQRRRIASGRMAHLCLENSQMIVGHDYTRNSELNAILDNPNIQPFVLYPGKNSVNLTEQTEQKKNLFSQNKTPVILVIDGTWNTARQTMYLSENLKHLPRVCFTPPSASRFRVRKQPDVGFYSTIEAIHHTIELIGDTIGFDMSTRQHDRLLYVFDKMVQRQLSFIQQAHDNPQSHTYRRHLNSWIKRQEKESNATEDFHENRIL